MPSYRVSTSTATSTAASTSTTNTSIGASEVSQPELAARRQCPQSYFVGIPIVVHTPDSTHVPAADQQRSRLRLLTEVSIPQIQFDPFEALAAHQTATFDSDDSSSSSNESSQPVEGSGPIVREEPCEVTLFISLPTNGRETNTRTTTSIPKQEILPSINDHFRRALSGTVPKALLSTIATDPKLLTGAYIATPKTDTTTDKWIIWAGDEERPFKCGYQGCYKRFTRKQSLQTHIVRHTGTSRFRCYLRACNGEVAFSSHHTLRRHTFKEHRSVRPFQFEICDKQYIGKDLWKSHRKHVHAIEDEKKSPRRKGK